MIIAKTNRNTIEIADNNSNLYFVFKLSIILIIISPNTIKNVDLIYHYNNRKYLYRDIKDVNKNIDFIELKKCFHNNMRNKIFIPFFKKYNLYSINNSEITN